MTVVTSPRLRVAIATEYVPHAVGLLCALMMVAVFGLFCALGVVTLMHATTLDGWRGAAGALVVSAEAFAAVVTIDAAMDASVRIGRRAERAALRWCEKADRQHPNR